MKKTATRWNRPLLSGCVTWYCPLPDPRGVGIVCPKDD